MSHHHLTREDRESIVVGLRVGLSLSEMAKHLGRHRSILSREVHRNGGPSGYSGVKAQNRYQAVRQGCRRSLKVADPAIKEALRLGMERHWPRNR
ncbi:transposase [Aminomonas paucivorans DSM 12260]|uniref:Transposase n=1 Tax=Aminomonas paucivorans DSM 12260 TaxID=584708 RepID=E3CX45_9BACT|nr:transposase [Aminomonas paucivorans DSM 12260]